MTQESSASSPWCLLGWVCTGHALSHFWLLTLPPLFPVLAARFEVTFVQLGLILTCYYITYGLFQIPSGYLVDQYGAKRILVAGLLLNGTAFTLLGLASTYALLLALALIAGIGQSVFHPANYAILSTTFTKENAGKPYSIHTFSGFAGSAVAPITVAALYQAFGWQTAFAIAGLLGVVLAILLILRLKVPETVPTETVPTETVPTETVPTEPAIASSVHSDHQRAPSFLSQALVIMFIFYVFSSMTNSGLQAFLPSSLITLYQMPVSTANAALTTYLTTLAVGVLLGGVVADKVNNHVKLVAGMFACSMIFILPLALGHPPIWLLFPILALSGAFHGVIMPSRDKMVLEAAPKESIGKSFGFVSTGISLGGVLAPPILGLVLDLGQANFLFWAIAVFMLIAILSTIAPRDGLSWRSRSVSKSYNKEHKP